MSRSLRAAFVVWVGCSLGSASAALAQDRAQPGPLIGFTGEWAAQVHEDAPYRGPGGFLGDYTGLPINAAARQMAESWDADILWQPERGPRRGRRSMRCAAKDRISASATSATR